MEAFFLCTIIGRLKSRVEDDGDEVGGANPSSVSLMVFLVNPEEWAEEE